MKIAKNIRAFLREIVNIFFPIYFGIHYSWLMLPADLADHTEPVGPADLNSPEARGAGLPSGGCSEPHRGHGWMCTASVWLRRASRLTGAQLPSGSEGGG